MTYQLDDKLGRYSARPKEDMPELKSEHFDEVLKSLTEKLQDLRETVTEIEGMMEQRKELGKEVCKEIEDELTRAWQFLREFERPGAIRAGLERIRGVYEQELFALKSERRKEIIQEWEDIARLKKDMREHSERMKDLKRKLKEAGT